MAPSHYSEEALPVNVERNMFLTEGLCVIQLYWTHLLSSPVTEELCAISSIGLIYLVAQCDQSCLLASYMGKPTRLFNKINITFNNKGKYCTYKI
jgi:hypothetical protein